MKAVPGDELVVAGGQAGQSRNAEILEVRGAHGQPPYRIRWRDSGLVATVTPNASAFVLAAGREAENRP